ncbi:unnamed protein product [Orchesella dallaii]|uniref:Uncharacterized protein n=1 Tax=Orchesella dallaii TaxID=48710 RepID=A0ABP1Q7H1_9HEXA
MARSSGFMCLLVIFATTVVNGISSEQRIDEVVYVDEDAELLLRDEEDDYDEFEDDLHRLYRLRLNDFRESNALRSAIQLHNITTDFTDNMKLALKIDHYDRIMNTEGVSLQKEMEDLENQYRKVLRTIEEADGGAMLVHQRNDTSELDKFRKKMAVKYEVIFQNTKAFTEKVLKSLVVIRRDKATILEELVRFQQYKKKYEETRGFLELQEIFLRNPVRGSKAVKEIDITVLQKLLRYYEQIDDLDDKILPILDRHGALDKMDPLTNDYRTVEDSLKRVGRIESLVKHAAKKNDNMLRHFEAITNAGIQKAQAALSEMISKYEGLQNRILQVTKDMSDQDIRIRALHGKLSTYMKKAKGQTTYSAHAHVTEYLELKVKPVPGGGRRVRSMKPGRDSNSLHPKAVNDGDGDDDTDDSDQHEEL